MKIRNLFFLLFLGVLIGFSSCKKDEQPPDSATLIPAVNTKSSDIDYIANQVNLFENDVINNKVRSGGCKLPVRVAMWYWENLLNLRYAYPELGGNSVKVNTTNISVQLTNGKIALDELQRVFDEVLSATANQFKMAAAYHPVSKQLNSGYFKLVSSDGGNGKAIIKYVSVIKYDDGKVYEARDVPFRDGDDWYWGWELGPYDGTPDFTHQSSDASKEINHYAIAHFGLENGYTGPIFMAQIFWQPLTTYPRYWQVTPYCSYSNNQPYLVATQLNLYYNRYIEDVQSVLDNSTQSLMNVDYNYLGYGSCDSQSYAEHLGRAEFAYPIPLPQIIADQRVSIFVD